MDKAKSTYLLVAANVVIAVFVVIFLIMKLTGTKAEPQKADGGNAAVARTVGEIRGDGPAETRPAAVGTPADQLPPDRRAALDIVQPPTLPPDAAYVPRPRELAGDTLEKVRQTQWLVKELLLAVELYRARHDAYPPSQIDTGNDTNGGIEALYACLNGDGILGPKVNESAVGNTDGDRFSRDFVLDGRKFDEGERLEILDAWGNALMYFRSDRYRTSDTYRFSDGTDQAATPQLSELTSEYHARDFVQIWSAGPNGKNENGSGDDVTSWQIRE